MIPSHKEIMDKMRGSGTNGSEEFQKILSAFFLQFIAAMKGEKGDSPSKEELIGIITPLVLDVVKQEKINRTTKEEIAEMVLTLIDSEDEDDDSLSESDVVKIIKRELPTKAEIKEIAKTAIPVDKSAKIIESLRKEINKLEEKIDKAEEKRKKTVPGGKPGGMGNPQHERFTVTTATSSITLVYKIAAQGEAIMAGRYQGQVLDKDIHYTVGGDYQTITFDSTMQAQFTDGDVVSFTYIRG